ncbi:hypothetical protein ACRALDRAFT_209508 [Sodiomyces alcalophilus JCM 7366]|uniref:uncharacterized protein n=1 Tax=Sodiomyces alcalophilus JCM 7366 TaxID=591952 RepID=UPI0039B3BD40
MKPYLYLPDDLNGDNDNAHVGQNERLIISVPGMAPPNRPVDEPPAQASSERSKSQSAHRINKLPRLPEGSKIQKRALPRRQQAASSKSHLVYVSTSTPFMAIVSRVRKRLDKSLQGRAPSTRGMNLAQRVEMLQRDGGTRNADGPGKCEVIVLGTGRAIEKTLQVASWFMGQGDCLVRVHTKTVGTVDDVVVEGDEFGGDSRVRKLNCLEVVVSLKRLGLGVPFEYLSGGVSTSRPVDSSLTGSIPWVHCFNVSAFGLPDDATLGFHCPDDRCSPVIGLPRSMVDKVVLSRGLLGSQNHPGRAKQRIQPASSHFSPAFKVWISVTQPADSSQTYSLCMGL